MRVTLLGTGAADGWPNPWCTCATCRWARAEPGRVRTHTAALLDDTLLVDCGPDVPRQADRAGAGLTGVRAVLLTHAHWDHTDPAAVLTRAWAQRQDQLQVLGPASALARFAQWRGPHGGDRAGAASDGMTLRALAPGDDVEVAGYRVRALAAAHQGPAADPSDEITAEALLYDVAGPDGARLLHATDTGPLPAATLAAVEGAAYDLVLLDETFGAVADHGTGHLDLATFPLVLAELRRRGAVNDGTDVVAVHLGHHNPPGPDLDRRLAAWGAHAVPDLATLTVGPDAPQQPHRTGPCRTLVLGGARSGKSLHAESILAAEPVVTYVATGGERPDDPEWAARVAAHRARRPSGWRTVETTDITTTLRCAGRDDAVLVDCLALWLTARLDLAQAWSTEKTDQTQAAVAQVERDLDELVEAVRTTTARVVLVSNEVGSGVVPEHPSGRLFRDLLGALNARIAAVCDDVTLVVAGRPLALATNA